MLPPARTTAPTEGNAAPVLWSDVVPFLRHLRTFAVQLSNQQLWCWGQDIRFPAGNLLLSYGLTRTRPPVPTAGSSHYQGTFHAATLSLWGFGIFCGHPRYGGLFVQRYMWKPVWTPHDRLCPDVWTPEDLPPLSVPHAFSTRLSAYRLLLLLVRWILRYERWIDDTVGRDYRRACLTHFPAAVTAAEERLQAWQALGAFYRSLVRRARHRLASTGSGRIL